MFKTKFILILQMAILMSGCVATENFYQSEITAKTDRPCVSKSDKLYLFFEGEPINFDYEVVGMVKSTGKKNASGDDVLNHLKYEAWSNCANAIINISQESVSKSYLQTDYNLTDTYNVPSYSGLAIQISNVEEFAAKYRSKETPLDFTNKVEKQKKSDASRSEAGNALGILAIVGTVIIVAIAVL